MSSFGCHLVASEKRTRHFLYARKEKEPNTNEKNRNETRDDDMMYFWNAFNTDKCCLPALVHQQTCKIGTHFATSCAIHLALSSLFGLWKHFGLANDRCSIIQTTLSVCHCFPSGVYYAASERTNEEREREGDREQQHKATNSNITYSPNLYR